MEFRRRRSGRNKRSAESGTSLSTSSSGAGGDDDNASGDTASNDHDASGETAAAATNAVCNSAVDDADDESNGGGNAECGDGEAGSKVRKLSAAAAVIKAVLKGSPKKAGGGAPVATITRRGARSGAADDAGSSRASGQRLATTVAKKEAKKGGKRSEEDKEIYFPLSDAANDEGDVARAAVAAASRKPSPAGGRKTPPRRAKLRGIGASSIARRGNEIGNLFGSRGAGADVAAASAASSSGEAAGSSANDDAQDEVDDEDVSDPALVSLLHRLERQHLVQDVATGSAGGTSRDSTILSRQGGANIRRARYLLEASAGNSELAATLYWEDYAASSSTAGRSSFSSAVAAAARGREANDRDREGEGGQDNVNGSTSSSSSADGALAAEGGPQFAVERASAEAAVEKERERARERAEAAAVAAEARILEAAAALQRRGDQIPPAEAAVAAVDRYLLAARGGGARRRGAPPGQRRRRAANEESDGGDSNMAVAPRFDRNNNNEDDDDDSNVADGARAPNPGQGPILLPVREAPLAREALAHYHLAQRAVARGRAAGVAAAGDGSDDDDNTGGGGDVGANDNDPREDPSASVSDDEERNSSTDCALRHAVSHPRARRSALRRESGELMEEDASPSSTSKMLSGSKRKRATGRSDLEDGKDEFLGEASPQESESRKNGGYDQEDDGDDDEDSIDIEEFFSSDEEPDESNPDAYINRRTLTPLGCLWAPGLNSGKKSSSGGGGGSGDGGGDDDSDDDDSDESSRLIPRSWLRAGFTLSKCGNGLAAPKPTEEEVDRLRREYPHLRDFGGACGSRPLSTAAFEKGLSYPFHCNGVSVLLSVVTTLLYSGARAPPDDAVAPTCVSAADRIPFEQLTPERRRLEFDARLADALSALVYVAARSAADRAKRALAAMERRIVVRRRTAANRRRERREGRGVEEGKGGADGGLSPEELDEHESKKQRLQRRIRLCRVAWWEQDPTTKETLYPEGRALDDVRVVTSLTNLFDIRQYVISNLRSFTEPGGCALLLECIVHCHGRRYIEKLLGGTTDVDEIRQGRVMQPLLTCACEDRLKFRGKNKITSGTNDPIFDEQECIPPQLLSLLLCGSVHSNFSDWSANCLGIGFLRMNQHISPTVNSHLLRPIKPVWLCLGETGYSTLLLDKKDLVGDEMSLDNPGKSFRLAHWNCWSSERTSMRVIVAQSDAVSCSKRKQAIKDGSSVKVVSGFITNEEIKYVKIHAEDQKYYPGDYRRWRFDMGFPKNGENTSREGTVASSFSSLRSAPSSDESWIPFYRLRGRKRQIVEMKFGPRICAVVCSRWPLAIVGDFQPAKKVPQV